MTRERTLLGGAEPGRGGKSRGFNANEPTPVYIEPAENDPAGGYIVDTAGIRAGKSPEECKIPCPKRPESSGEIKAVLEEWRQTHPDSKLTYVNNGEPVIGSATVKETPQGSGLASISGDTSSTMIVTIKPPNCRIDFEFESGTIQAHYHRIFKSGVFLVLVWDTQFTLGTRFIPNISKIPFNVIVGREKERLMVYSVGIKIALVEEKLELLVLPVLTPGAVEGEEGGAPTLEALGLDSVAMG